jgi:hypothetical protein
LVHQYRWVEVVPLLTPTLLTPTLLEPAQMLSLLSPLL